MTIKKCYTCKYENLCAAEYPCNYCAKRIDKKYWEPKEDEEAMLDDR